MKNLNWNTDGVGDWVRDDTLQVGLDQRKAIRDLGIIRDAEHDFEFTYAEARNVFLEVFGLDDGYLDGFAIAVERLNDGRE